MRDLSFLARIDAVGQAELVRRGESSASELVEGCIERLGTMNPLIHAVVSTDLERARQRATEKPSGPLGGVPFLVKDVVAYPGLRWSFGSRLFAANVAPAGAPFTERIDAAGLVTLGKTATSEFGLLGSTETLLEGVTHNPWDLSRSAAGSSGGAAAAVAAGIVPLAHASDGGGSIRIPASVNGLFGLMPSRGRCVPTSAVRSDFGDLVMDLSVSRTVRDTAMFLSITEASEGGAFAPAGFVRGPSGARLRIATWTRTLIGLEPEAEPKKAVEATIALLQRLGHEVEPIETSAAPDLDGQALSDAFFTVAGAAVAGVADMMGGMLGRPVGKGELEPFTLALAEHFRRQPAGTLERARATFAEAARRYLALFDRFDAVLTPTVAVEPWRLGELSGCLPREEAIRRTERAVGYTPIHNIAGCPAMSVPLYWTSGGLPIGTHLAAKPGAEAKLLELAYQLEDAQPWRDRWAPWSYPRLAERDESEIRPPEGTLR